MQHIIFALILACSTAFAHAQAGARAPLELAADAPERHVVVQGDTLWGISSKFLKDAYRWPELWRMNAEQVRNPHRIYPGQVLILDRSGGDPRLRIGNQVRISPQVYSEQLSKEIPAIPASAIEPFLAQPLVIDANGFAESGRIIATQENRVFTGTGDLIYAAGDRIDPGIKRWHVFRPGKPLMDPDTREVLGYEAVFAGSARTAGELKDVLPLEVTSVRQEIGRGDYIVPAPPVEIMNYVPHAPTQDIDASVIAIYGGVGEAAVNSVVSLTRGKDAGLEIGHVLSLHRRGKTISNRFEDDKPKSHTLPDERYGLVFVFRVFDRVSYALVTAANRPVMEGDRLHKP